MSGGCFECRGVLNVLHWKMGKGIEKSEEAERGGRGQRYETLSS